MYGQTVQGSEFTALSSRFRDGIGRSILHLVETTSTMDVAKAMIDHSTDITGLHGKVIIAEKQQRGRGRFGRRWFSYDGEDILMSAVVCPRASLTGQLSIMAGLAAALTVDEFTTTRSAIKWPNDVQVDGAKVCGVLSEGFTSGDTFAGVLGIGLNVNSRHDTDATRVFNSVSLRQLRPPNPMLDRGEVLRVMLTHMNDLYDALDRGESILPEWRDRLETLGREVELTMMGAGDASVSEKIIGVAEDVDDFGRLLVREPSGIVRAVATGDVTARSGRNG